MQQVRGTVLHCGRYGCIVRLENGKLANLSQKDEGHGPIRRALQSKRRPQFEFSVSEVDGRLRLALATAAPTPEPGAAEFIRPSTVSPDAVSASSPLDEKIIEYLRQTEDWDPKGAIAQSATESKPPRADRLLPFEQRARRQYRDSPKKPPRKKR
jgi:hypothetical protein